MTLKSKQTKITDIYTVFTYRYIFDEKNDIVNLHSDVYDLQHFPERLMSSYNAEWQKYNRKAANKRNLDLSAQQAKILVSKLTDSQQKELSEFLQVIEKTAAINASSNIKVIKTEFKSYIESLLKL
jgi:hypothetical protein